MARIPDLLQAYKNDIWGILLKHYPQQVPETSTAQRYAYFIPQSLQSRIRTPLRGLPQVEQVFLEVQKRASLWRSGFRLGGPIASPITSAYEDRLQLWRDTTKDFAGSIALTSGERLQRWCDGGPVVSPIASAVQRRRLKRLWAGAADAADHCPLPSITCAPGPVPGPVMDCELRVHCFLRCSGSGV